MPRLSGKVQHHCPLNGKGQGNCRRSLDNKYCTRHQAVCITDGQYFLKDEGCPACKKKLETEEEQEEHSDEDDENGYGKGGAAKNKDKSGRSGKGSIKPGERSSRGKKSGGPSGGVKKSGGRSSDGKKSGGTTAGGAEKIDVETQRITRFMTRVFKYYLVMKKTSVDKHDPDGRLLLIKSLIAGTSRRRSPRIMAANEIST